MLPVLNKPILQYVIENMKRLGVEVVFMIVGYKKHIIQEYFGDGTDWDIEIKYLEQNNPRGIAHAIGLVENYVSEPFLVILGDDLTVARSLDNLTEIFWENKALAVEGAVAERDIEVLRRTCCLTANRDGRVIRIEEKPSKPFSNLRGCGVYVFDPLVFGYIEKTPITPFRNEKEITVTLDLIRRDGRLFCASVDGYNINVNTLHDLKRATNLLLSNSK